MTRSLVYTGRSLGDTFFILVRDSSTLEMWRFQLTVLATLAGPVAELLVTTSYPRISRCWPSWGKYSLGQNVKFKRGDHILQSLVPVPYAPVPPSHVFFAISDNLILHIEQDKEFPGKMTPYPVEAGSLRTLAKNRGTRVVKPDPKYPWVMDKGAVIAERMMWEKLPYNKLTCNCNHYADYLTYGRTFGARWKIWYQPVSIECPLYTSLKGDIDPGTVPILDGYGNDMKLIELQKRVDPISGVTRWGMMVDQNWVKKMEP